MTQFFSDAAITPRPSLLLNRLMLDAQIGRRRAALAALVAKMIAACDAEALGARSRTGASSNHASWDRATWHRYLAAAMRLEAEYGPRMRRLRHEIDQLERLMSLPIAA